MIGYEAWLYMFATARKPTLEVLAVARSGELLPYFLFLLDGLAVTKPVLMPAALPAVIAVVTRTLR